MCPLSILESCPKLQTTKSGRQSEHLKKKKVIRCSSLSEQKESLDWTKVCGICHSGRACFDYTGDCMG